ncbi:MAG: transposase [Candidatus Rokuibacteriota bacterium]
MFRYLEDPALTPILRELITRSALPLKAVEIDFAADSSGFTTSRFHRWYDHKYGVERQEHDWVKVHIMVGVKTNVVTAIEIAGRNAADTKQLPALVAATAKNFAMAEVSADKGYASAANIETVKNVGAEPFIAFRTSDTGWSGGAWAKALGYFMYRRDEFLAHYHKRSNVETAFSMMKRKFGDFLRAKTDTAMVNEALAKVLCHNWSCWSMRASSLGSTRFLGQKPRLPQKPPGEVGSEAKPPPGPPRGCLAAGRLVDRS